MSAVTCTIGASPAEVFGVLADGWCYSNWVVGTSHVRAVEAAWPQQGSRLHHATGAWPMVIRDETVVTHVEQDKLLELRVRGWPAGEASVTISLRGVAGGTELTMTETPTSGPGRYLHNSLLETLLNRRNTESLARLVALTERHTTTR